MESSFTKLCRRCSGFEYKLGVTARKQDSLQELYVRVDLARNIWALQTSAKRGCVLCRLFYQAILYGYPGILQRDWLSEASISLDTFSLPEGFNFIDEEDDEEPDGGTIIEGGSLVHTILRARSGTRRIYFRAGLAVKAHSATLQSDLETMGYGPITTLSSTDGRRLRLGKNDDYYSVQGVEAIAKLGRKWLSECRTLHQQCNDASQEGHPDHGTSHIIPTRLVDVGLDGDEMLLRLTITNGSGLYSGYATLSYAWGDESLGIKTTSSNLQEMTRKIDPSELSKTIREAVIMTRKLGIRYLWVDALCILQSQGSDDAQHALDWQHEAARFGQYYENSIITIAATGAQSAREGLFLHRAGQAGSFEPHTVR